MFRRAGLLAPRSCSGLAHVFCRTARISHHRRNKETRRKFNSSCRLDRLGGAEACSHGWSDLRQRRSSRNPWIHIPLNSPRRAKEASGTLYRPGGAEACSHGWSDLRRQRRWSRNPWNAPLLTRPGGATEALSNRTPSLPLPGQNCCA
jgi:hypothetical protein